MALHGVGVVRVERVTLVNFALNKLNNARDTETLKFWGKYSGRL